MASPDPDQTVHDVVPGVREHKLGNSRELQVCREMEGGKQTHDRRQVLAAAIVIYAV